MSTAVESSPGVEWLNGHDGPTVGNGGESNGDVDEKMWQEQFLPPPLRLDDPVRAQKITRRLSALSLCGSTLRRVGTTFLHELQNGLQKKPSSLQMENTYVPELPNGTEEGVFLALDLGGTNFRILLLELKEGELVNEIVKHYHISDELRLGTGEELFNFLADCVLDFVRAQKMENHKFNLGFTFSFPMKHHSISSGELITWTKSFNCSGMEGVDLAGLLQRCLDQRGLKVKVRVLLNDTTGTLVAGAHLHPDVGIGVILGTGSNGSYMEVSSRVQWEQAPRASAGAGVLVDVEWGAFGDNACLSFLRTEFDDTVDNNSLLANSFTFEKYIGGKYLGCLLTALLQTLHDEKLFPVRPAPRSLLTSHLSLFEEEAATGGVERTRAALLEACGARVAPADARVAQYAAALVSRRAAMLVSVCIAKLLERMNRPHVTVAVDGSVYKRHPTIRHLMKKYIALLAPGHRFTLMDAEDGSGKGSALTAAIAARIAEQDS